MSDKAIYTIELNDRLSPGLKKAVNSSKGFDNQMGKTRGSMGKSSKSIGKLGAMFSKLAGPVALAAAGMKAFMIASDAVKISRNFESLTNAINAASGSSKKGAENMSFLRERAQALGLPLLESVEGFKTLAGAFMGTKMEGAGTLEVFDAVAGAATVMGLGAEETKGTFLALGQMMSKGKVSAEELNGQLGERLPGALGIAARAMGKTKSELMKLMADGKLMSEDFLPKFAAELRKTFAGDLPKAVNSSQAQLNRFNNLLLEMKLKIGKALLPILNKLMTFFTKFVNFLIAHKTIILNNVINPVRDLFLTYFNTIKDAFGDLFEGFGKGVTLGEAFRAVLKGIGFYIKNVLTPVLKVIGTVFGTVLSFVIRYFVRIVDRALSTIKVLFATLKSVGMFFYEYYAGLGKVIKGAFTLDVSTIKKGYSQMKGAGSAAGKAFSEVMKKDVSVKGGVKLFSEQVSKTGGAGPELNGKTKQNDFVSKFRSNLGQLTGSGGGTTGKGGKESSTSVDGIKSGRPTHINIDIGKLIENMNITAANVDDLTGQIKDQVAQALFSAVNNVNNIAGV